MGVPSGDQRDWDFATYFNIRGITVFEGVDGNDEASENKNVLITSSDT